MESAKNQLFEENERLSTQYAVLKNSRINSSEKTEQAGQLVMSITPDGKRTVKSGSVSDLVARLVDPSAFDIEFLQSFLLSHHLFMDSSSLLEMLLDGFRVRVATGSTSASPELIRYTLILKHETNFSQEFVIL